MVENVTVLKTASLFYHRQVGHKTWLCECLLLLFITKDWGLIVMASTSVMCIGKDNGFRGLLVD